MSDLTKSRLTQLYGFLKAANQLRFRPVRSISEQPKVIAVSRLPQHESIQFIRPVRRGDVEAHTDVLLRVRRPELTRCPSPPPIIEGWLLAGWDDPSQVAAVAPSKNITVPTGRGDGSSETITVSFGEADDRLAEWKSWNMRRDAWATPERTARAAMGTFEAFYGLHSSLEKEGEQLELLAADGHLSWQTTSSQDGTVSIDHPVLLKRVELRFDPNVPEFSIHETDREPEVYSGLFVDLQNVNPAGIRARTEELEKAGYHPFGWGDTVRSPVKRTTNSWTPAGVKRAAET